MNYANENEPTINITLLYNIILSHLLHYFVFCELLNWRGGRLRNVSNPRNA